MTTIPVFLWKWSLTLKVTIIGSSDSSPLPYSVCVGVVTESKWCSYTLIVSWLAIEFGCWIA